MSGNLWENWKAFWFHAEEPYILELIRIGLGLALLCVYGSYSQDDLSQLYSDQGWVSLSTGSLDVLSTKYSLLFYLTTPAKVALIHFAFMVLCLLFTLGIGTSVVKWMLLLGHVSFVWRNPGIFYGMDNLMCNLLFILCFAPIGQRLSLRPKKKMDASWRDSACLRLIQIQMVVCYFYAAIKKLKGDVWWSGDALWYALAHFQYTNLPIGWLAENYWIINFLTYWVIVMQLAYVFLIWGKKTRPFFLAEAILLHVGIALFMGIYAFSFVMIVGHFSFVKRSWLVGIGERFIVRLIRKPG